MKTIYNILIFTSILLISCGKGETKSVEDKTLPIIVKISKVSGNSNTPYITTSGKIQAENSAELSTRIMGFVNKIYVNVGDKVEKGQLLLTINNTDLLAKQAQINANILKAETGYKNAEKDYKRFKILLEQKSVSQKEFDDITSYYNIAKADLEAVKQIKNEINAQFSYSNIKAPFSGVITNKFIKKGTMANPGKPLISLEGKGNFEVITMVPESEISKIEKGITVNVLVKTLNKTIKGKVSEVSTSAKNTGGQYLVKINLEKTDINILSGMFVSVQFPVEKSDSTAMILIPEEAIVKRGQLKGIYTVSTGSKALLRWLRLGRTYGNQVEVLSGLSVNESYIISSEEKLYNGAKISIQ
ncbi:efflux RND transporter periplasmic adaptor subunit [Tenacibaculum sp. ZS6-P6]|uniref:efflux RND transporter periplasmic adaptor subunit n=1 Tax=Tenacibaculum sp. ZS6-P6 TaxID=3447503 RepID=UPI003F96AD2E